MQSIETTGKSLNEARKQAAAELGVAEDNLEVTVLEEVKGLFGKSTVRIRAEVKAGAAEPEGAAEQEPRKARGRGGKPKKEAKPEPEPREEAPALTAVDGEGGAEAEAQATDEDATRLKTILDELLESGGLSVEVKISNLNGRYVNLELDGRDVAFLVGKHGEVLNALQYLVNIIAGRKHGNGIRATLEGDNYRRQREERLRKMAMQIAEQVADRNEEAVLDALPAFERRIVHNALSEMKGVTTYSEGEEPNRRVVIAPAE
jgi:spoIIIJ-associated protein